MYSLTTTKYTCTKKNPSCFTIFHFMLLYIFPSNEITWTVNGNKVAQNETREKQYYSFSCSKCTHVMDVSHQTKIYTLRIELKEQKE